MTAVITVYQPYASLIMAGVKTWETRGLPPNGDMRPEGVRGLPGRRVNAGDRIGIHTAKRWAPGWVATKVEVTGWTGAAIKVTPLKEEA